MNKIFAFLVGALLLVALATVAGVPVARAHAEIQECTPAIDGTVETAPEKLECTASQGMESEGSKLQVFDANGVQVDKGDSLVDLNDPDRTKISVSLDTAKMTDGVYTVKWTTVSADDGDEASGEFKFTVGHAMDHEATPGATVTGEAEEHEDHSIAHATVDGKEVTLQVIAPAKGATLPAGDVKMEAKVEGITLGENGAHLHFYVDETLAGMGEGAQTSLTVNLEPGKHDLTIGLATGEHAELMKAHVHVTVEGTATQQETSTVEPTAEATATAEPTQQATAAAEPTQAAEPTAEATAEASPTTAAELPATGAASNNSGLGIIAILGLVVLGAGAVVLTRVRR